MSDKKKHRMIVVEGGYHGKGRNAMSLVATKDTTRGGRKKSNIEY